MTQRDIWPIEFIKINQEKMIYMLIQIINNPKPNKQNKTNQIYYPHTSASLHQYAVRSMSTHKERMLANPTLNCLRTRAGNLDLQ